MFQCANTSKPRDPYKCNNMHVSFGIAWDHEWRIRALIYIYKYIYVYIYIYAWDHESPVWFWVQTKKKGFYPTSLVAKMIGEVELRRSSRQRSCLGLRFGLRTCRRNEWKYVLWNTCIHACINKYGNSCVGDEVVFTHADTHIRTQLFTHTKAHTYVHRYKSKLDVLEHAM